MIIDFHNHFMFPDMASKGEELSWLKRRIEVMDYAGVDISVLFNSRDPGDEQLNSLEACRSRNKYVADAVKKFSDRFVGLVSVPIEEESICISEVDKSVKDDGFLGVGLTGSWFNKLNYDQLRPLYKIIQELNIPVFVHGAVRPILYDSPLLKSHMAWVGGFNLPDSVGRGFELMLSLIRFIGSGALDEFPKLKIVFAGQSMAWAHKGRIAWFSFNQPYGKLEKQLTAARGRDWTILEKLEKSFDEYWNQIFFDTAGSPGWSLSALRQSLVSIKPERIVFGTDYSPEIASGKDLKKFVDGIKNLNLTEKQKNQILGENAKHLFNLKE